MWRIDQEIFSHIWKYSLLHNGKSVAVVSVENIGINSPIGFNWEKLHIGIIHGIFNILCVFHYSVRLYASQRIIEVSHGIQIVDRIVIFITWLDDECYALCTLLFSVSHARRQNRSSWVLCVGIIIKRFCYRLKYSWASVHHWIEKSKKATSIHSMIVFAMCIM